MPRMKKGVEGLHTTDSAETTAKEARPVKEPEKAPAAPMPTKVVGYSELSPVIRKAITDYHKKQGARPDWPNVRAAMQDCLTRIQRQWSQILEESSGG